ncbi:TatD family deoxyribonuclease [Candidatus Methylopumilus rimovensis]|uniref:TatD family deoxyribonuclease n=1 Tax=Candidatus Methylopumilus rimovensis TaxID=2588535 RepID=A0AAE6FSP0_9PROT|nr:TatD family hydrolase [Candidatus Methylopumilus rimovensis]QDD13474.1 TatD family deoxyribonuclease [Candidatus Methylopumilus rimovensis]
MTSFVDSHCHINFPELYQNIDSILSKMSSNKVTHALCVSVTLDKLPDIFKIANTYPHIFASVGVHPDCEDIEEPSVDELCRFTKEKKVVAIGETGLDYFRVLGDLSWQRDRFRTHIKAAIQSNLPLIIHTRNAAEDTLKIMREEGANHVGGVMHCFTESLDVAFEAIKLNFYISFSGIVTFKNATDLKEVVKAIPLDRILIETDSPYLAPVPYRGKINDPSNVIHVAEEIAKLKNIPVEEVGEATTQNFFKLFSKCRPSN